MWYKSLIQMLQNEKKKYYILKNNNNKDAFLVDFHSYAVIFI